MEQEFTNEEINALAEWLETLTIAQIFFLKDSYEAMLQMTAKECGSEYVH